MIDLLEAAPSSGSDSVNAQILNSLLRRQVVIANAEDEVVKRIARIYAQAGKEIAARITAAAARSLDADSFTQQLTSFRAGEIRSVILRLQGQVAQEFQEALDDIWRAELETGVKVITRAIPDEILTRIDFVRPNILQIDASNTQVLGQSLGRWGEKAATHLVDELAREIAVGVVQGDDMRAMIKRTADVFGTSKRRAEATARTAVMTVSNEAQARLYEDNADIMKGAQYTATFDRQTCEVCAGYDGREYYMADGTYASRPRTPVHMRCACSYTPITKSWRELGIDIDDVPPGPRASMNGEVPGKTTMHSWMKGQPKSVANHILGKERADLWRAGKVDLGAFTNERTSRPFPLRELKARLDRAT